MVFSVEIGADKVPFVQLGDHQLRLDLEELDEDYKEVARNELRETPEIVEEGLRQLKEFVINEPYLSVPLDDDAFLTKFLRPFKYYPESAFKMMMRYYKFKAKHPKYAMNLTPNGVKHVFDSDVFIFLPTRTPSGSRIMIINAGTKWNPKEVSIQDMFRAVIVSIEIAMMEPKTQVGGVHVILNMEGFSLMHVCQLSPYVAKLIADWVQECAPIRLKAIHIINQSMFFNMGYAIFKPFLGEKLKKLLHFHGSNKKALCEMVSSQCLPQSLGGDGSLPDYPGKLLSEMFFYYEETFKRLNTYCYSKDNVSITD